MLFYISIFAVISFLGYVELNGIKKQTSTHIAIAISLFLFILSFIRWENGSDWDLYYNYFESISYNGFFDYIMEPLYSLVLVLAKSIYNHYTIALLILGGIVFYFQTKALNLISVYPIISLLVLYGMSCGNIFFVRQIIAQAILLFAFVFIIKKNLIKFSICIIVASGFHISALIFFPAYWLFYIHLSKKQILLFTLISLFLSPLMRYLISNISFFNEITMLKLELYSEGQGDVANYSDILFYFKAIANRILFYLLGFYMFDKINNESQLKYANNFFVLFSIGSMLFFMLDPISNVFGRLVRFYEAGQLFMIPFFLQYQKQKNNANIFYIIVIFVLLMKLIMFLNTYDCYIPFKISPLFA